MFGGLGHQLLAVSGHKDKLIGFRALVQVELVIGQSVELDDGFQVLLEKACILCAACTTSCPVFWTDGQYFGPAAIVNAHRFIFDSRDEEAQVRLDILNDKEGVWRCRTTFNCTEACPRGIEVTKAIAEVKQAILRGRV